MTKQERELLKLAEKGGGDAELFLLDKVNEVESKVEILERDIETGVANNRAPITDEAKIERIASRLAVKLSVMEKGDKGDTVVGPRGSKFIGSFTSASELPSSDSYQEGDFAVVDGTIWYIV